MLILGITIKLNQITKSQVILCIELYINRHAYIQKKSIELHINRHGYLVLFRRAAFADTDELVPLLHPEE